MIQVLYNPRCSKCRDACEILENSGEEIELIKYLEKPPTKPQLKKILKLLGIKAEELLRKKEELYIKKFSKKKFSNDEWIDVMIKNPILIERPVIINGKKAIIGRPPEKVLEII